ERIVRKTDGLLDHRTGNGYSRSRRHRWSLLLLGSFSYEPSSGLVFSGCVPGGVHSSTIRLGVRCSACFTASAPFSASEQVKPARSEERRVGKEWRALSSPSQSEKRILFIRALVCFEIARVFRNCLVTRDRRLTARGGGM